MLTIGKNSRDAYVIKEKGNHVAYLGKADPVRKIRNPKTGKLQTRPDCHKALLSLWKDGTLTEPDYRQLAEKLLIKAPTTDCWRTPPDCLEMVREVFGGEIDTDPATWHDNPTNAKTFYTIKTNGLAAENHWRGNVFMNPPFSGINLAFAQKLWDELQNGNATQAIALVKAGQIMNKGTGQIYKKADLICMPHGRINYVGIDGEIVTGADFDSVFCYFGGNTERFREVFGCIGEVR